MVDNWFMRKLAFRDIDRVQYIVTAFSSAETDVDDLVFIEIKDEIKNNSQAIMTQLKKQDDKIKDIQRMITKLIKMEDPDL